MNCNNNQNNNNGCGCNCNPHPTPAPEPVDINMSVCDRNINMLPMLQTYTTKVLKPNIDGCCKKNILKQCMMNCENYKYVIKWDFDLNGETITVPENCILEFDGGSLKNGTIIGQNTVVNNIGDLDNIFGDNLVKDGEWIDHFAEGGHTDRPYDPDHFVGMGKEYVDRNIMLIDGVEKNVLTQDMINQPNTIYVIQYDFILTDDIEIPENCMLLFDGGRIIPNSHNITGNLLNKELCVKDFMDGTDITDAIKACLALCNIVYIPSGNWDISESIIVGSDKLIYGRDAVITETSILNIFVLQGHNIKIDGLVLVGKVLTPEDNPAYLIDIREGSSYIEISNCSISKCTGAIISYTNTSYINIHHNRMTETVYHPNRAAGGYGVLFAPNGEQGSTVLWDNIEIHHNYINAMRHCAYMVLGNHCSIHDNVFIMSDETRTTDYDVAIQDGGVYNMKIFNNTQTGGVGFYDFKNYRPDLMTGKIKVEIRGNKITGVTSRSFGTIEFLPDYANVSANIKDNFISTSNSYNSAIRVCTPINDPDLNSYIDGFNIEGNTIEINGVITPAAGVYPYAICFYNLMKGVNNVKINNNTIRYEGTSFAVFFHYISYDNAKIQNVMFCDNYIKGGQSAFGIHDCVDISCITIKGNICEGQHYTPIYFDGNTGVTKNIICTENQLYIDPQSASGVGVGITVTQGWPSVIEKNIEVRETPSNN